MNELGQDVKCISYGGSGSSKFEKQWLNSFHKWENWGSGRLKGKFQTRVEVSWQLLPGYLMVPYFLCVLVSSSQQYRNLPENKGYILNSLGLPTFANFFVSHIFLSFGLDVLLIEIIFYQGSLILCLKSICFGLI